MNLTELADKLFITKRAEDAAKKERILIEEEIAKLVETGDNGSKTVDVGDGVKVTVKRSLSYEADVEAIRSLDIPSDMTPVRLIPQEWAFDEKKYEKLRESDPDIWKSISVHVSTHPRKVSVTLKL